MSSDYNNNELSDEMKKLIEEKRQKAILLRERRAKQRFDAFFRNNALPVSGVKSMIAVLSSRAATLRYTKHATNSQLCVNQSIRCTQSTQRFNNKQDLKLSMKLLSSKRFEVMIDYNSEVFTIFRKFATNEPQICELNRTTTVWSFDVNHYIQLMRELCCSYHIEKSETIPQSVIIALNHANRKTKYEIDLKERLSDEFVELLFDFQKDGIIFGIQCDGRCLIADDMAIEKTMQAIGIAMWFRKDWPLIVVCQSSMRYQWFKSITNWVSNLTDSDILVVKNTRQGLSRVSITIISYDVLTRLKGLFATQYKNYYKMLILDDSHNIKSAKSKRTVLAKELAKSCLRVVLINGTPEFSKPIDLFSQISLIDPKLFGTKHHIFGSRYCNVQLMNFGKYCFTDYNGANHLDELSIILSSTVMIRRLKNDVFGELIEKYPEKFAEQ